MYIYQPCTHSFTLTLPPCLRRLPRIPVGGRPNCWPGLFIECLAREITSFVQEAWSAQSSSTTPRAINSDAGPIREQAPGTTVGEALDVPLRLVIGETRFVNDGLFRLFAAISGSAVLKWWTEQMFVFPGLFALCTMLRERWCSKINRKYNVLLTALLQCRLGYNRFHAKLHGCATHPVAWLASQIENVHYGSSVCQKSVFTHQTGRDTEKRARQPGWGEGSSANFTPTSGKRSLEQLLKGTWSTSHRKDREREGRGVEEDTNKKCIWHMTVTRNLRSAKSVTNSNTQCRRLWVNAQQHRDPRSY